MSEKITVGTVINNYEHFCILTGMPYKNNTNSKNANKKEWRRFYDWRKEGHKFIITEVKETIEARVDGRCNGNNSRYVEYTTALLLHYIYSKDAISNNVVEIANKTIYSTIGLHNELYNKKSTINSYIPKIDITRFNISDFYSRSGNKFNEIKNTTLNNLVKTSRVESATSVYKINDKYCRTASKEEESEIRAVENIVLLELNLEHMRAVYKAGKESIFFDKVNEQLETKFGWNAYRTNEIVLNIDHDIGRRQYLLDDEAYLDNILAINKEIHSFLDKNAEHLYSNNKEMTYTADKKPFVYSKNYVKEQKYLSELLVKHEH